MSSKVFWIIFDQIKILKRKRKVETFFQRELLLYVCFITYNQFYEQFLKLN